VCTPGLGKGERVRRAPAYSKEKKKKEGLRCLLHLHLQGAQAGAPRHTTRHISSKLISDIFYKIANEAGNLVRYKKKGSEGLVLLGTMLHNGVQGIACIGSSASP